MMQGVVSERDASLQQLLTITEIIQILRLFFQYSSGNIHTVGKHCYHKNIQQQLSFKMDDRIIFQTDFPSGVL